MVPRDRNGPPKGKPYLYVFLLKNNLFLQNQHCGPISIKLCTNHIWLTRMKCPNYKRPGSRHMRDINKNGGEGNDKFSPREPLSQNSSDLHGRFLI